MLILFNTIDEALNYERNAKFLSHIISINFYTYNNKFVQWTVMNKLFCKYYRSHGYSLCKKFIPNQTYFTTQSFKNIFAKYDFSINCTT